MMTYQIPFKRAKNDKHIIWCIIFLHIDWGYRNKELFKAKYVELSDKINTDNFE